MTCSRCLSTSFDAPGLPWSQPAPQSISGPRSSFGNAIILLIFCILQLSPFLPQTLLVGEGNGKPLKLSLTTLKCLLQGDFETSCFLAAYFPSQLGADAEHPIHQESTRHS